MKYAIITGACGGLAKEIISMLKETYTIFALDKAPTINSLYCDEKNIKAFQCDITNKKEILDVKEQIQKITNNIDLIINFAGIVMLGSTVEIDEEKLKKLIDVNLIGMYSINKNFFDMLKKNESRIINISSEYGKITAVPFHSFYTMSKHAVEIYNDSLRREVKSLGIKVIKIRPGAFKTNMQQNIENQFEQLVSETQYFEKPLYKMKGIMIKELKKAKDTKKIVKVFKKAIEGKHPKKSYNVNNSFKMKLLSILPSSLQDYIFKIYFK